MRDSTGFGDLDWKILIDFEPHDGSGDRTPGGRSSYAGIASTLAGQVRSVGQRSAYRPSGEARIARQQLLRCNAGGEVIENDGDGDASARDAGLPMTALSGTW